MCGASLEAGDRQCRHCGEYCDNGEFRFRHKIVKRWSADYGGHVIDVINWWDVFMRSGEELRIDGEVVASHRSWFCFAIRSEIRDADGAPHTVRAHIGSINWGLAMGCQIFIDDQLIGGDIKKTFIT
jgi:hypothetical protein